MKKIFILFMAMCVATIINAQSMNMAGSSRFLDNWSVGVNGGVQTNLHDWNAPQGATFGVELNKQLTPLFGLTAELNAGVNNRMNWYSNSSHVHNGTSIDQVSVLVDGRFNLMNAFSGYKGTPRLFEIEALAGVGYGHGFGRDVIFRNDVLLAKAGVNFNFNVGKTKAWTITVRPAVLWNVSNTGKFDSRLGVGQLTAGVVYHFKNKSNKKHYMDKYVVPEPVVNVVEKTVVETVEKPVVVKDTVTTVEYRDTKYTVYFAQNKAVLTETGKTVLDKIDTTTTVVVDGYASPEGTVRRNNVLSLERANVVKEYLESRGVKVTSVNGHGVVGNESGRVVIVTVNE